MGKKYDLAVPIDRYQKDGQDKTKWMNVGVILETQNGHLMKLDAMPITVVDQDGNKIPFNGWINMFAPRKQSSQPAQANPSGGVAPDSGFDNIPFIDPYKFNWRAI